MRPQSSKHWTIKLRILRYHVSNCFDVILHNYSESLQFYCLIIPQVELAKDFGAADKPRAWSKYSEESTAHKKLLEKKEGKTKGKKNKKEEEETPKKVSYLCGQN